MNSRLWDGDFLEEMNVFEKHQENARRQWETFVATGRTHPDGDTRAEVVSSWLRCKNLFMDPYSSTLNILPDDILRAKREENRVLLATAGPILREMAEGVADSGIRLDLFDHELYLLDRFHIENGTASPPKRELPPGTSFREKDLGTNAVALAKILENPVQLIGYEHYKVLSHNLTCAAVPIRDANGNIIAVLNADCYIWPIHKHTLGMMIAARKNIEMSFHLLDDVRHFDNRLGHAIIGLNRCAGLAVNARGVITSANSKAAKILRHHNHTDLVGRTCESLWGSDNPLIGVLQSGREIVDREVTFLVNGNPLVVRATIARISGANGEMLGVYATLEKASQEIRVEGPSARFTFDMIISNNPDMLQTIDLAKKTVELNSNTLLLGESGTGKEMFAQAIHNAGRNRHGPFIAVNCAAIPAGLVESELFGYEGGAFTGARKEGHIGKFEQARDGTIFLDEINSLPTDMQVKLLRAIQDKTITRVGGTKEVSLAARFISATNKDLWNMVREGKFREDLYYRINVISIGIPPLRERGEDIKLLVEHFLGKLEAQIGVRFDVSPEAFTVLMRHDWPGNVRELENVIERSVVYANARNETTLTGNNILLGRGGFEAHIALHRTGDAGTGSRNLTVMNGFNNDPMAAHHTLEQAEYQTVMAALHQAGYVHTTAARILKIHRNTLRNKLTAFREKGYHIPTKTSQPYAHI